MAKAKRTKTIDIINTLKELPKNAQRNVISALIGGLNMSIIAMVKRTLPQEVNAGGIDVYNERVAELALQRVEAETSGDNGHEIKNPIADIEALLCLRGALADHYLATANREPLTVAQSLEFLCNQPVRVANDEQLAAIAEFTGIDTTALALLKKEAEKQANDELIALNARSEEIIDAVTVIERDTHIIDLDTAFFNLDYRQKFKLCARLCKSLAKQIDRTLIQMLRGSVMSNAVDLKLLKQAHNDTVTFMEQLPTTDDAFLPEIPAML